MKNPFIENGFINPNVSINKLIIGKVPDFIDDKTILGRQALEIFSTKLFIEEIKNNAKDLKLDLNKIEEKMLPQYLNDLYESHDYLVREAAENIVKKFGQNLGIILLTLKKGEKENRVIRKDWNSLNWDYWTEIKNVILVGGLASSRTGEKLKHYAEEVFYKDKITPYNIILDKDSANAGIRGCATYIKSSPIYEKYLIFDFGQTFIKRSKVKFNNSKLKDIESLNKIKSEFVDWEFDSIEEEKRTAEKLNDHIIKAITNTIKESSKRSVDEVTIKESIEHCTKDIEENKNSIEHRIKNIEANKYFIEHPIKDIEINKNSTDNSLSEDISNKDLEENLNISKNIIGDTIIISIANYVQNGKFANRGGYGKLRLISSNYEEYLSDKILETTNRKFQFKLIHDGTAMAAGFLDYKHAVCISLGTAFGVGFPLYKS